MLSFVLCDDNSLFSKHFSKLLESIFIENNIDANLNFIFTSPNELLNYISKNNVDVLFLDIKLSSSINGCDIAKKIRKTNKNIYIIFITGHLEYALIAYKYKTFDYLLKPISKEKLSETILRLFEDINGNQNLSSNNNCFITLNKNTIIHKNEINYIKKDKVKLIFCCKNCTYQTYSSFKKFKIFLPDNFIQCHKSYILNLNNVLQINYKENFITFHNNDMCFIGPNYKQDLLRRF